MEIIDCIAFCEVFYKRTDERFANVNRRKKKTQSKFNLKLFVFAHVLHNEKVVN